MRLFVKKITANFRETFEQIERILSVKGTFHAKKRGVPLIYAVLGTLPQGILWTYGETKYIKTSALPVLFILSLLALSFVEVSSLLKYRKNQNTECGVKTILFQILLCSVLCLLYSVFFLICVHL